MRLIDFHLGDLVYDRYCGRHMIILNVITDVSRRIQYGLTVGAMYVGTERFEYVHRYNDELTLISRVMA